MRREKYLPSCEEQRKHFTPLVYSVDGMVAKEAQAAVKNLARQLSEKWHKTHSEVWGYLSGQLSIGLVRSTSMCLRNSRLYKSRPRRVDWGDGCLVSFSRSRLKRFGSNTAGSGHKVWFRCVVQGEIMIMAPFLILRSPMRTVSMATRGMKVMGG